MKYVKGIIGGLLGGIIGVLPWILVYIYGNYMLSLLAFIIAFGIAFGYKLFKGPIDKFYPITVAVLSIIIVVVATLVVIPLAELAKLDSLVTLQDLYRNSEFVSAITKDLIIAVIFTILGISGVIAKARQEILENNTKEEISKPEEVKDKE